MSLARGARKSSNSCTVAAPRFIDRRILFHRYSSVLHPSTGINPTFDRESHHHLSQSHGNILFDRSLPFRCFFDPGGIVSLPASQPATALEKSSTPPTSSGKTCLPNLVRPRRDLSCLLHAFGKPPFSDKTTPSTSSSKVWFESFRIGSYSLGLWD